MIAAAANNPRHLPTSLRPQTGIGARDHVSTGETQPPVRPARRISGWILVALDAAVVSLATLLAYYVRFEGVVPEFFSRWMLPLSVAATAVFLAVMTTFGLYRLVLRYVGIDALLKVMAATALGFVVLLGVDLFMPMEEAMRPVPVGVLFIQAVLVFMGFAGVRITARVFMHLHATRTGERKRVLVVGAGSAGPLLLREIQGRPDLGLSVLAFLDDDRAMHGRTIGGVPVVGATGDLARAVSELDIAEVIVAMPSAPQATIRRILNAAAELGVHTRVVPQLVTARGSVSLHDLRPIEVEDLLGREPAPIDTELIADTIADKVIAVTGAAGSIGSELCRQIIALRPRTLVLIDIDETRLFELGLELEARAPGVAIGILCDVRDAVCLDAALGAHKPEAVFHAAAYKHVPLMQLAPAEAIKANVGGTIRVIEACERHGVRRFVLLSTDKAVAPVNVMGLTKALAERVMLSAVARGKITAVAVRFGNVLGSRGSVVPVFQEQLRRGGPLTVTHPDVTRYFMTIPEAARLVLQAQAMGEPGDVFVLEMGEPVRIDELARKMIALSGVPAEIEYVGLRPGEKLHETLVSEDEHLSPTTHVKIMRVGDLARPDAGFDAAVDALVGAATGGRVEELPARLEALEPGFASRESAG